MSKIKFYNLRRRLTAFALVGTMATTTVTITGCNNEGTSKVSKAETAEEQAVNFVKQNIKNMFPNMKDDIVEDTTLILLLDVIAPENENGKRSAEIISIYKPRGINPEEMMRNYNSFLNVVENSILKENKAINISSTLPEQLMNDKIIVTYIEKIVETIRNSTDKTLINSEFDKLMTLFVEEKELDANGFKFKISDLTYGSRALVQTYARSVISSNAKEYIAEEKREKMDERTNNQDNKALIRENLAVLDNQIDEVSKINVELAFNNHYSLVQNYIDVKVALSDDSEKNLVNYLNLKYLDSGDVAHKDKNQILSGYEESDINDVILSISAIMKYNQSNQDDIIAFSNLLLGEYKQTQSGKVDKDALDFVQNNCMRLLNTVNEKSTYSEIFNNPYFQNLKLYIMRDDFTHKTKDANGNTIDTNISWQEISNGVNFVADSMILDTLSKLPQVKGLESFTTVSQSNLEADVRYITIAITGECENVDVLTFTLS